MGVRFEDGQRLACAPDILSRILDGEAVLLDLASGTYFGLNPVGSRVWELISASKTVGEIRVVIQQEFDVTDDVLTRDLDELFTTLEKRGLIRVGP